MPDATPCRSARRRRWRSPPEGAPLLMGVSDRIRWLLRARPHMTAGELCTALGWPASRVLDIHPTVRRAGL